MGKKYRISDLILDSLKCTLLHLLFYATGFVVYAASVGHIMSDKQADISAKRSSLMIFSAAMIVGFIAVIFIYTKRNVGRKTVLIEASRADDFDYSIYYRNSLRRKVLPFLIGGLLALLPYAVFYTLFGWDYLFPSVIDRFYSASMLAVGLTGGIIGWILHNAAIAGAYAYYLFRTERAELEDRMWLKDAPHQENVKLNPPRDNYKNY